MKQQSTILIALSVLALGACSVREQEKIDGHQGREMIFTGEVFEEGTKTAVQSDASVWWTPGDAICIFHGASSGDKFSSNITEQTAVAEFKGTVSEEATSDAFYWAVYPFSSALSCNGTSVTAILPDKQVAQAGSFAPNTNITLARSENTSLAFFNVCSGLWFTVTREGIESVTVKGNANEDIAGTFSVSMSSGSTPRPTSPVVTSGKKSITLSAPEGETLQVGKKYYIVLLPQTFSDGVTLTFNTASETGIHIFPDELQFERSLFKHAENADEGVFFVPKTSGNVSIVDVQSGGGTIKLPDDAGADDAVILNFTDVTDKHDYAIEYSSTEGAQKPGTIYIVGAGDSSVGILSGELPQSTVHMLSGTYAGTNLKTALSTLIIEIGVKVGTVSVNGGSLTVNGIVTSISVSEDAAGSDDEADKIIIIINSKVTDVDVQETNCTVQVTTDGEVASLDTQAQETEVGGTVGDLTAGENAGSVTVQSGGEVTGTLNTQAENTTIQEGAAVNDITASGDGTLTVEGGATVESVNTEGNVTVDMDVNATTSSGGITPQITVSFGADIKVVPVAGLSVPMTVSSNGAWKLEIPSNAFWLRSSTSEATITGDGTETTVNLVVSANTSALARQTCLVFSYGSDKTVTYTLLQAGTAGFTADIEDWADGGDAGFGKK